MIFKKYPQKQTNYSFALFAISIILSSCQDKEGKEAIQKTETKQEVILPKPTNEAKLNGQFIFDLTMEDKNNPSKKGRDYITKKAVVDNINLDMTFYGNSKGVGFLDNGKNKYMTQKMIESQQFEYKIQNDTLLFKTKEDSRFKSFAVILDEGINKDYFEVHVIGTRFPIGLYKIGESPKQ
ncbi:hypothetical protein [Flavobacterium soli]|uniref:hypothetical protein n=1 Tax=Flavobacterium soli TaxID=344881 RepID=UPI00047DCFCC|nr:hypothetical protein [Flavobacterium soli]